MDVPVVVVSGVDTVLSDTAVAVLTCDSPGVRAVTYRVQADRALLRTVSSARGVEAKAEVALGDCLSCALRQDVVEIVATLAACDVARVVVALPVTMDPVPVCFGLRQAAILASSVVVFDAQTLLEDLMGEDSLADRELGFGSDDDRTLGEALARQLETADLLAPSGSLDARGTALLDHVVGRVPTRVALYDCDVAAFDRRRPLELDRLGDLRIAASTGAADAEGVWTVDLQSWKPFHPQRLHDRLERLGCGRLRGRGYFWLPTRPQLQCAWDGAGGQLSIGELDRWDGPAATRLVITGVEGDPRRLHKAFAKALMTDAELAAGLHRWTDVEDGFDDWLGPRADHCADSADLIADED
ncbi:MAG: GTP-binding protein [Sporichthyaceae bacterium]